MADEAHLVLRADDRSYFALLKKEIHARAVAAGFSARRVGEVDIIVAELVTNLVKHASGGQILVKGVEEKGRKGIEILSIDNGPGMNDVNRMMSDGVSTTNTLGHGLGSIKRLADVFQVYSQKEWGTLALVRVFAKAAPLNAKPLPAEVRSVVLPKPGETECGDGFFCEMEGPVIRMFLGDGLGHGADAAHAVQAAGAAFLECTESDPPEIIRYINERVRKTRGLVGTVALFDTQKMEWQLCGVGTIATRIITAASARNYMAYNGIIGHNVPRTLNTQVIPWEKGQNLVMCSDGIRSRWDLARYPALLRHDLALLGAALIKDFARLTDDMSVAACKINT
jgi:anti-sigma regulatory factor (Ser/Thr protein kinase)